MSQDPKYTVIWQSKTPHEIEWINEIFGNLILEHVFDGEHKIVLDNSILIDAFINRFDQGYYEKFRGKNSFLINVLDETYAGGYGRYANFKGIFRDHHSSWFNSKYVFDIPSGYYKSRKTNNPMLPPSERKYAWSFVGELNKATRPDMVRALLPIAPSVIISTSSIYSRSTSRQPKVSLDTNEYYGVLEDSIFSPSPMGNVNIVTYRIYEALEAGSIPIVEKRLFLDYYRSVLGENPIPRVASWKQAASLMAHFLDRPEELRELQSQCSLFWIQHKVQLRTRIGQFMAERSREAVDARKIYHPLINLPAFKYVELLKHHNLSAVRRRVTRQFGRIARDRRWRISS